MKRLLGVFLLVGLLTVIAGSVALAEGPFKGNPACAVLDDLPFKIVGIETALDQIGCP